MRKFIFNAFVSLTIICFFSTQIYALISLEDEEIIGARLYLQIKKEGILIEDDFASRYIDQLGHYLIRPLKTKPFEFHFYIINKDVINAFASPGGYIYIFSGLINMTDSADELAAVICHEIGHISARHIAQKIEHSKKLGYLTLAALLASTLIGGQAASGIATASLGASAQLQINFTRDEERQADELGFKYISASGFDPTATYTILKKITDQSLYALDKIPPFLIDHPIGPERLANIQFMLSSYKPIPATDEVIRFRKQFPLFKTIVYALSTDPDNAKRYYEDILKDDPESALAYFGLGIVYSRLSEYKRAISCFKKTLSVWPDSIPVLVRLAMAYQNCGKYKSAIKTLNRVLDIDDTNNYAMFLLGLSYENLRNYKEAIRIFKRLSYLRPVNNDVYYHLGVVYGRLGKLALAHYNFGIYFSNLYSINKAKFHFLEAKKLAKGDTRLLNAISVRLKTLKLPKM